MDVRDKIPNEGQGGSALFEDPHQRRADMALFRRALKEGWKVPERLKQRFLEMTEERIETATDRDFGLLFRCVVAASDQEIKLLKLMKPEAPQTVVFNDNRMQTVMANMPDEQLDALESAMSALAGASLIAGPGGTEEADEV